MSHRYVPGEWSRLYHRLSPHDRSVVNAEIDKRFSSRTGITRRLDAHAAADRAGVDAWLRVRDEVMAERASAMPMLAPVAPPGPALAIPLDKQEALKLVDEMLARTGPVALTAFGRADVSAGLRVHILDPGSFRRAARIRERAARAPQMDLSCARRRFTSSSTWGGSQRISSSTSATTSETARSRYHLWSAGTMCQGEWPVLQRASASA